jgi:magnesium-transporting ATPase (P-type)
MAAQADTSGRPALAGQRWSACSPHAVEEAPGTGLSSQRAAELPRANGPSALPEEKPKPGWRRFLDQYRSYLQLILVGAAVVSLVIKEWSTRGPAAGADAAGSDPPGSPAITRLPSIPFVSMSRPAAEGTTHVQLAHQPACRGAGEPQRSGGLR